MKKISKYIIISSVLFFVIIIVIAHLIASQYYSLSQNTISDLASQNYPYKWIMQIGFIGFGLILNSGIFIRLKNSKKIIHPGILIMIYGLFILLSGIFCTESFYGITSYSIIQSKLHSIFASISGLALSFGILWYVFIKNTPKKRIIHLVFFILIILFSMLFGLAENGIIEFGKGIIQRIMYFTGLAWIVINYGFFK